MKKIITFFLFFFSTPAIAGDALLDLSGQNNSISFSQLGDSYISLVSTDPLSQNNTFNFVQSGGNHYLDFELNGVFEDYEVTIFQTSLDDQFLSVTQTCTISSCSPEPFSLYQY